MADETFKLPGSSYGELVKIIRAYGHANDDAVPKDVADRAGIDPTIVSRNNAFLVSINILAGGKKKSLTPLGRNLASALDHEILDQIASAWHQIVADTSFLAKIISAVKIRGGMDHSSLRSHIAYTAGAPNKPATMTGAGSVVDVLKASGFLREDEGGKIFATTDQQPPTNKHTDAEKSVVILPTSVQEVRQIPVAQADMVASVQIQVRIECTPADVESLGSKLRKMLDTLQQSEPGMTNKGDK